MEVIDRTLDVREKREELSWKGMRTNPEHE